MWYLTSDVIASGLVVPDPPWTELSPFLALFFLPGLSVASAGVCKLFLDLGLLVLEASAVGTGWGASNDLALAFLGATASLDGDRNPSEGWDSD